MIEEQQVLPGLVLRRSQQVLHLASDQPLRVLSSAVVGGGLVTAQHILNMHVSRFYDSRSPDDDLRQLAQDLGIAGPFVGLMTAVLLERVQVVVEHDASASVAAIVTVGIGNVIAAGVTAPVELTAGTINLILLGDVRLDDAARVNAVMTATEAKTLALVESGVAAPHGGLASGTSTDAVVIATTERGAYVAYAGPVSPFGALIARATRRAVLAGIRLAQGG